jgi:uncharacterized protein (DUF849 family)
MAPLPPVIITCAVTGSVTVPSQSPAIPVTPEEIVDAAVTAHAAGAACVHVHVREPDTGRPTPDPELFAQVITAISERCDVIVVPTTGGAPGQSLAERARVITEHKPEMASFNTGSLNFGVFTALRRGTQGFEPWEVEYLEGTRDYVFRNSFKDMEGLHPLFAEAQTKPEFETYDVGHLYNLHHLWRSGVVAGPLHIQFVLGVLGGNAANVEQLIHMHRTARDLFRDDFTWSVAGMSYPGEFHMAAVALTMGGNVRVGLEDNLRIAPGRLASSNVELVEKVRALAELLDRPVATSAQARELLGLKGRLPVAGTVA